MSKSDRMKASDVFQATDFAFAEKTSFEKAFPTIEEIKIEVVEEGDGVKEWNVHRTYGKLGAHEYINCSNKVCYNGGFCLGDSIRYMITEGLTEYETNEYCQGYEGSPKGRKRYRKCLNHFEIKINIKYKNDSEIDINK